MVQGGLRFCPITATSVVMFKYELWIALINRAAGRYIWTFHTPVSCGMWDRSDKRPPAICCSKRRVLFGFWWSRTHLDFSLSLAVWWLQRRGMSLKPCVCVPDASLLLWCIWCFIDATERPNLVPRLAPRAKNLGYFSLLAVEVSQPSSIPLAAKLLASNMIWI